MYLWMLLWLLVPIAGIILVFVKGYSYRFVPYIMLSDPDISATDALKRSMTQTKGYRGKMFIADLLIVISVVVLTVIFIFIGRIPGIGTILLGIYIIALIIFLNLIFGILGASYYDKITKENPDRM